MANKVLTVGSLFAGIGGFDLGLERTGGFKTVWQVEIDDYARQILAKHWPDVRRWDDVRTFPPESAGEWGCDLICGGFPCQDISNAGKRAGIDGERSGLWSEFARIIGVVRPRFVFVENVAALLGRDLGRVLGDLAALGYDAEWSCISAADVGAAQSRERVWLVANSQSQYGLTNGTVFRREVPSRMGTWWQSEPGVVRVANGVSSRLDRLRCLGNAVVPQVAEFIGRHILTFLEKEPS